MHHLLYSFPPFSTQQLLMDLGINSTTLEFFLLFFNAEFQWWFCKDAFSPSTRFLLGSRGVSNAFNQVLPADGLLWRWMVLGERQIWSSWVFGIRKITRCRLPNFLAKFRCNDIIWLKYCMISKNPDIFCRKPETENLKTWVGSCTPGGANPDSTVSVVAGGDLSKQIDDARRIPGRVLLVAAALMAEFTWLKATKKRNNLAFFFFGGGDDMTSDRRIMENPSKWMNKGVVLHNVRKHEITQLADGNSAFSTKPYIGPKNGISRFHSILVFMDFCLSVLTVFQGIFPTQDPIKTDLWIQTWRFSIQSFDTRMPCMVFFWAFDAFVQLLCTSSMFKLFLPYLLVKPWLPEHVPNPGSDKISQKGRQGVF